MRFAAELIVTLREGVLDTQGKAVTGSLHNQGYDTLEDVRIGRVVHLTLRADDEDDARRQVERMCDDLLVNDLIEEYRLTLETCDR